MAVTSEEQEYYDKDSGLSYAYHTQYQLDESGQIDYSKAMVVIPLALKGTLEGSGVPINVEGWRCKWDLSSSFHVICKRNSESGCLGLRYAA